MISAYACCPAVVIDSDTLVTPHRSTTNTATSKDDSEEDVAVDDAELVNGIEGFNTKLEEVNREDWEAFQDKAHEDKLSQTDLSLPVAGNTEVNVFTHLLTLLTEGKG